MGKLRDLICPNRKSDCARPDVVIRCFFFVYILVFPRELQTRSCLIFPDTLVFKMEFGWRVGGGRCKPNLQCIVASCIHSKESMWPHVGTPSEHLHSKMHWCGQDRLQVLLRRRVWDPLRSLNRHSMRRNVVMEDMKGIGSTWSWIAYSGETWLQGRFALAHHSM